METYNFDDTNVSPGFGPEGSVTPSLPEAEAPMDNTPVSPGFGPEGSVTPSLPNGTNGSMTSPGFGPIGPVTPSLPSGNESSGSGCINCGTSIWPGMNNGVLWTWGTLSPFFSASSEVANVRFYNAAAIREPLDIYLNGRLVVSNLDYMNYTRFLHIIPAVYRLTVFRRTNPGTAIIDTNVRFRSGTSYTLTILGGPGDYSVQMITA